MTLPILSRAVFDLEAIEAKTELVHSDEMLAFYDQDDKRRISKRRLALRLPYSAGNVLSRGLKTLIESTSVSRARGPTPTSFSVEVDHYRSRHDALGLKGPRPRLRSEVTARVAQEQALKIDAGLNFAELSEHADPFVKPILLYYACAHLCRVYSRTFFRLGV
jgi:hypothetical protein